MSDPYIPVPPSLIDVALAVLEQMRRLEASIERLEAKLDARSAAHVVPLYAMQGDPGDETSVD